MTIPFYQVDAFTDTLFHGNPAGVCPLDEWLPDDLMQSIAEENRLSETAFFVPRGEEYHLRWFTPVTEVDLCGHATLATAYVLFERLGYRGDRIDFQTRSGKLSVARHDDWLALDFPAQPPVSCDAPDALLKGLGKEPVEILQSEDYLALFEKEEDVAGLEPDFRLLGSIGMRGVIATAPGREVDFVSRFFAPKYGIDEDPVTGSAHCALAPFWARRLGKSELTARQTSPRGGELRCALEGDRVLIYGRAVLYLEGMIRL